MKQTGMKENYMDHQTSPETEYEFDCFYCNGTGKSDKPTLGQINTHASPPSTHEETNEEIEAKFAKASKKIIDNAPVVAAYKKVDQEEPTTQKELTLEEIHELKSVGLISANWYAVRHEDNKIPIAILCNEAYANAYRDQFSATSVVEPWPMIVSDIRKPIKQIFSNGVISSEPTQEELWINVKDRLPEGNALLLTSSQMIVIGDLYQGKWRVNGKWHHNGNEWVSDFKYEDITHWQPLPSPPKKNQA